MSDGNGTTNYVVLGGGKYPVYVWADLADQSIHITCDDPRLTDEHGGKPGFRVVFNANPRSADYNPGNFNRLGRYLRSDGKPAPDEAPLKPRQLNRRAQVIAELTGEMARPTGRPTDPALLGWATCPTCTAVVMDLERHRAVSAAC